MNYTWFPVRSHQHYNISMKWTGPGNEPSVKPPFQRNIVRLPFPVSMLGRPLAIGGPGNPTGANLLLPRITPPAAPANNTVTVLNELPAGVPAPPALGTVFRCRIVDQGDLGPTALSPPGAIPPGKIKLRFWLYTMPWRAELSSEPNSNANSLLLQVSLGQFEPPGIANSRVIVELGNHPAVGSWLPVTIDTDTRDWQNDSGQKSIPCSPFQAGIRLSSGNFNHTCSGPVLDPNPCDFLIAFDSLAAAGPAPLDYPGLALPPASAGLEPEKLRLDGFACGDDWSALLAMEIPDDAWDSTVPDRPGGAALFTFFESPESWIKVIADPDAPLLLTAPWWNDEVGSGAVRFIVQTGSTRSELAVAPSQLTRPQGQDFGPERFSFQRGNPVFIGVTVGGPDHRTITCYASVGGTTLASSSITLPGADAPPHPTALLSGDETQANPASMYWWGGELSTLTALDASAMTEHFRTLGFLSQPSSRASSSRRRCCVGTPPCRTGNCQLPTSLIAYGSMATASSGRQLA